MSEKMHSVTTLNVREITIKAVTVFTDRAEINRTFTVSLKPGMNEIKLQNIPGRIDEDSIRVNGKGLAVIHEVKFEIEEINIENSELPKIGENSVTGHGSNLVSFNEASETSLEKFFEYHERKCIELNEKMRDTAQNISTLDLEVNQTNAEINRFRMDIGRNCIISIEIENKNAENDEVEITVTYNGAPNICPNKKG
uniref:DUF4140 domain-containing protein n=1 Tax=Panagrolaimus sp. PS1159 TaxID=55785 RepID=A0AC35EWC5_9BILA